MNCDECGLEQFKVFCADCEQALCTICEDNLHRGGKRQLHVRTQLCHKCRELATALCLVCNVTACPHCVLEHTGHHTERIVSPKRVGVFWDFTTCRPHAVKECLEEISHRMGVPEFVRVYGALESECSVLGVELVGSSGIHETERIMLDISLYASSCITHVFVISERASEFKSHLIQLAGSLPYVKIIVSERVLPIRFMTVEQLVTGGLLQYIEELADRGLIAHEMNEFVSQTTYRMNITQEAAKQKISELVKTGDCWVKQFESGGLGDSEFLCKKERHFTLENLMWVVKSLKQDGMRPREKWVRKRLVEVLALDGQDWAKFTLKLKGSPRSVSLPSPRHSKRTPLFNIQEKHGELLFYPVNEHWTAMDSEAHDSLIRETEEWADLLQFINEQFSRLNGGKYEMAQLVKLRGPASLQQLPLGRLIYMIRLCIQDGLLTISMCTALIPVAELLFSVRTVLCRNQYGLTLGFLEELILLRHRVCWRKYYVNSFLEFLKTYGKGQFKVIYSKNSAKVSLLNSDECDSTLLEHSQLEDCEEETEENKRFWEELSRKLHGTSPIHYSTDSVQFHSSHSSASMRHGRTQSERKHAKCMKKQGRMYNSCAENWEEPVFDWF